MDICHRQNPKLTNLKGRHTVPRGPISRRSDPMRIPRSMRRYPWSATEGWGGLNQQMVQREVFRQNRQGWKVAHVAEVESIVGEAHWMRPEKRMTEAVVAAVGCRRQTTSGGEVTDLTQGQGSSVKSTAPQIGRSCQWEILERCPAPLSHPCSSSNSTWLSRVWSVS